MSIEIIISELRETVTIEFILQGLLAITAIGAVLFSGLTWRQAVKFQREQSNQRRAYIVLSDKPGYLRSREVLDMRPVLALNLYNIGLNPCDSVKGVFLGFVNGTDDQKNEFVDQLFFYEFVVNNPLPHKGKWIIELDRPTFESVLQVDFAAMFTSFYAFKIEYRDVILNETFSQSFYWKTATKGKFQEVESKYIKMMATTVDNHEFTST